MPAHLQGPLHIPTQNGGISIEHDGVGSLTFSLDRIRDVGVASLAEVLSHDIVRVAGLVSHRIELVNGGHVTFAFNQAGQVVELSGTRTKLHMTTAHSLSIRALPVDAPDGA
jgi:hypothetical protein